MSLADNFLFIEERYISYLLLIIKIIKIFKNRLNKLDIINIYLILFIKNGVHGFCFKIGFLTIILFESWNIFIVNRIVKRLIPVFIGH